MSSFVNGVEFVIVDCANCYGLFAMTREMNQRFRKNGKTFHCPMGHGNWYGESEEDLLKKKLKREKESKEYLKRSREHYREKANQVGYSLRATKGVVTKLKKKIAAGKCPACEAEFDDLKAHMENDHPGYVVDETLENRA